MFTFFFRETFPVTADELLRRTLYDFSEYEKFSPDVTRVEELSRDVLPDGREKITIRVFAKASMPESVRILFKVKEMDWKEHYWVDVKTRVCDWEVETPMFQEYVDARGTSHCNDIEGGSEMVIKGSMTIRPMPVFGVPPSVVQSVIRVIEPFVGNMVSKNLKKYSKCVRECMEKEAAAARKAG